MAIPQHTIPETPPLAAVAMLSAAVLAYEILLMRLFAIVHWHHFAFMMISIALLGYGASGTCLMLLPSLKANRLRTVFLAGTAGFSVACVVCFVAAQRLPFNALEVLWHPGQWGYLAGVYGLLFLPFFMAATGIGAVLRFGGPRISQIYAADLSGAGIGAAITAGLLFRIPPQTALVVVAAGGAAAAVFAAFRGQVRGRRLLTAAAAGWLILAGLGTLQWETVAINAYKPLAQTLRMPDTRLFYEKHHPMGWFSAVRSPTTPFRYAPGLSLQSDAAIPDQIALFIDGQGMSVVDRYDGDPETLAYLRQTTVSVGLHLRPQANRVFIADAAGGQDILRAMAYGARRIDAVDPHPLYAAFLRRQQNGFNHVQIDEERIRYRSTTVRAFLQASPEVFDLIQLPLEGDGGSGASAFGESTLLTAEGLHQLWRHLDADGLLVMPLWTRLPPRSNLKAFLMAVTMLEEQGVSNPSHHLAMIRDWRTAVILISRSVLSVDEQDAIRGFCRMWGFDPVFLPGLQPEEVNRHNVLARPFFAEATQALAGKDRETFRHHYKFDLRPATDDRPFFGHFFQWRSLPEIASLRRAGGMGLLDWGYPVLLVTLAQAVVFSLMFIGLPVLRARVKRGKEKITQRFGSAALIYFSAVGGGFLFLEIAYMQRLTLALHHPLVAATLTLTGFLIGAGAGSAWAHKTLQNGGNPERLLRGSLITICLVGLLELPAMPWLMDRLGGTNIWLIAAAALGMILPLAMAMGMPFALGLDLLNRHHPQWIPWAWSINGCATVISAVAAPLIAMTTGYTGVIGLALLLYAAGYGVVPWMGARKL
jgi:GNAT superfamily N-acetyltransferase